MSLTNEEIWAMADGHSPSRAPLQNIAPDIPPAAPSSPDGHPNTSHRHNPHSNAENEPKSAVTPTSDVTEENGHFSAPQAGCDVVTDTDAYRGEDAGESTGALIQIVGAFLRRYVVLSPGQELATALFVLHTHAFDVADATPYLHISSAEKESGKSRLLEVLELLVREPLLTANLSEPTLFRSIRENTPTVLLDEVDALFGPKARDREDLRGMLNAGHRRGAVVLRCVGDGSKQHVERFPVFCPKALAGIGALPDTMASRSIPIRLKRRSREERVERFRYREAKRQAQPLFERVEIWAIQSFAALRAARPELPDALTDRAQDCWEPLLAIADHAGGEWGSLARSAAKKLSSGTSREDSDSLRVALLLSIRDILSTEHISSADLLSALNGRDEEPWGGWNKGAGLRARNLASLLKPFDIHSRTVRFGDKTAKGYLRSQFEDAWARYLPAEGAQG